MADEKKAEEPQYAAEQYAVNDYAVPADYVVPQEYYTDSATAATTTTTDYEYNSAQEYTDPNAQYYDPNQYYYDYNTGSYIDASSVATATTTDPAYNYDQYYAHQPSGYYDQSYTQQGAYHSGAALPESVTAIQSAATANAKYPATSTSTYNTPATQAPKVYYPSTANANNPIGPIIITKSGYSGPSGSPNTSIPSLNEPAVNDTEAKKKTKKVVRAAGGEVWEDHSLEDWDDNDFRLFAGDLGNEVTEEILYKAFSKYPSLLRTRVVRDTRTMKSKGFGFISFRDPDDFVKAWREMNGKFF